MQRRQLSQSEISIKAATKHSIVLAGGLEAAELFVRVGKSQLANYYNPNETECFVPVDIAMQLDELACYPHILEAMQAASSPSKRKPRTLHTLLANMLKEAGELGTSFSTALEDGSICPREATDITKEAMDLKEACQHIIDEAATVQARKAKVMA
jgi:hypothetical protein